MLLLLMHTLPQQALQSDSTATEEREKAGSCRKRRETTELGCPSGPAVGLLLGPCWLGFRSVHKRSQDTRAYIRSVAPGRPPTRACVAVQDLGWLLLNQGSRWATLPNPAFEDLVRYNNTPRFRYLVSAQTNTCGESWHLGYGISSFYGLEFPYVLGTSIEILIKCGFKPWGLIQNINMFLFPSFFVAFFLLSFPHALSIHVFMIMIILGLQFFDHF